MERSKLVFKIVEWCLILGTAIGVALIIILASPLVSKYWVLGLFIALMVALSVILSMFAYTDVFTQIFEKVFTNVLAG